MVSFENFVKSMPPSLSELKVTPSFCFPIKIRDDRTASTDNSYSPPPPYSGNNENITINNFSSTTSYNEGVWGSSWGTRTSERYPRTSERYSETRPLLNNGTNEDLPQNNCLCVIGSFLVLGVVLGGAFFLFSAIGETNCFISLVQ